MWKTKHDLNNRKKTPKTRILCKELYKELKKDKFKKLCGERFGEISMPKYIPLTKKFIEDCFESKKAKMSAKEMMVYLYLVSKIYVRGRKFYYKTTISSFAKRIAIDRAWLIRILKKLEKLKLICVVKFASYRMPSVIFIVDYFLEYFEIYITEFYRSLGFSEQDTNKLAKKLIDNFKGIKNEAHT